MNNILQLKGEFQSRKNTGLIVKTNLPNNTAVSLQHIINLQRQLMVCLRYWNNRPNIIGGTLISVHYKCIVAKSNRLKILLREGSKSPNESIRGAKFVWEENSDSPEIVQKHVFTHFISLQSIENSIKLLDATAKVLNDIYDGQVTDKITKDINDGIYDDKYMPKTNFLKVIVDSYYVERFDVDESTGIPDETSIITLYKTGVKASELLRNFGIDTISAKMLDETTFLLEADEIRILQENVPYLIAMGVKDLSEFTRENIAIFDQKDSIMNIPKPGNEPVVGVIDTQFDETVYFHDWVQYENKLSSEIEISTRDCEHGTAVSSIIVDGPAFNPTLDDGCGRFKVRHFGVATAGRFSSFTILKLIRNIVSQNRDIKVWNLSLGSAMEINANFISPEAAELDRIQNEYDVIFVVAGTNRPKDKKAGYKIGAPADSLNSLVVNSVDFSDKSASYTRVGPVLSFFHKPDVSYYGGEDADKIAVCGPTGIAYVAGTSYAAPWITRKMAYLIHIMKLSRETAKALLIDSAAGWSREYDNSFKFGYGIVPININDILYSKDDEIKFIMNGTIDAYETYTYNIPVPQYLDKHPFFAKATLVYFPKGNRNQGVDYTSTEMDIHFGRTIEKNGKATIKSINGNQQSDKGLISIPEQNARKMYRKWDNVKHICEGTNYRARPRQVYGKGLWGLSIKTKERSDPRAGRGLGFGVVITLKEMNGVNRIDDFIKLCMVRGWLIDKLDVEQRLDVYQKSEEDIDFE